MHDHKHNHTNSRKNLKAAFFLNFGFTLIEIAGGFFTNSMAILSDALHDLGDSLSLGLSWYLDKKSEQGKDRKFSFGYRRFSLLGAWINSMVLITGSVLILIHAVPALWNPEEPYAQGMIWLALGGILVNGLAVLRLQGGKSMNEKVITWHLLEDVLGWIAVLIVSITLLFTNWHFLDPLLSIGITLFILYNIWKQLRETTRIFLQGVPDEIDMDKIEQQVNALECVHSIHHMHVWSLDGEHHILTAHIVVPDNLSQDAISHVKNQVKAITEKTGIYHVTLETEFVNEPCEMKEMED